jgi:hypothetical protein
MTGFQGPARDFGSRSGGVLRTVETTDFEDFRGSAARTQHASTACSAECETSCNSGEITRRPATGLLQHGAARPPP